MSRGQCVRPSARDAAEGCCDRYGDAMSSTRAARARWTARAIGVLAAACILCPLPGPTPMRCTYDGDSGTCRTLGYRTALSVTAATVMWGSDVVQGPH